VFVCFGFGRTFDSAADALANQLLNSQIFLCLFVLSARCI